MLEDEEGVVKISVWGNAIHDIIEDTYSIKSLIVDDYFGIRLATTSCTTFDVIQPISIYWQQYNISSNTSRHCPPHTFLLTKYFCNTCFNKSFQSINNRYCTACVDKFGPTTFKTTSWALLKPRRGQLQ